MHFLLMQGQVTVAASYQGISDIPLPSNGFQLLLGDPKVFLGQKKYVIPPVSSESAPGSPPSLSCSENLQRNVIKCI